MFDLKQRVRMLELSNLAAWCIVIAMFCAGFTKPDVEHTRFTEIDAERVNIVGANGKPVLVLANRRLIPGPSMNGKQYPRELADGRQLVSGMIFFNDEGDEVGGLIFNGFKKENGYSSVGHLSFDQWKQNQVVALQYIDGGKSRRAGLGVWDRPTDVPFDQQLDRSLQLMHAKGAERESLRQAISKDNAQGAFGVQRVFVGSRDRTAQVQLYDTHGRVRARLSVDDHDHARLEFLDDAGKVVAEYPPGQAKQ